MNVSMTVQVKIEESNSQSGHLTQVTMSNISFQSFHSSYQIESFVKF